MKRPAGRIQAVLIIVDVQQAFTVPPRILEDIRRYSRLFPRRIFTQFVNPPGSIFHRKLRQHSCLPGSDDLNLLIKPDPGDWVVRKTKYGLGESALRRLKKAGFTKAIVCGVDTDACVLGVMFSLFDAGITCHAKEKLCWSSNGLQKAALEIMRAQFPSPR